MKEPYEDIWERAFYTPILYLQTGQNQPQSLIINFHFIRVYKEGKVWTKEDDKISLRDAKDMGLSHLHWQPPLCGVPLTKISIKMQI